MNTNERLIETLSKAAGKPILISETQDRGVYTTNIVADEIKARITGNIFTINTEYDIDVTNVNSILALSLNGIFSGKIIIKNNKLGYLRVIESDLGKISQSMIEKWFKSSLYEIEAFKLIVQRTRTQYESIDSLYKHIELLTETAYKGLEIFEKTLNNAYS